MPFVTKRKSRISESYWKIDNGVSLFIVTGTASVTINRLALVSISQQLSETRDFLSETNGTYMLVVSRQIK